MEKRSSERKSCWAESKDSEYDIVFKMSEVDFPRMVPISTISLALETVRMIQQTETIKPKDRHILRA